METHLSLCLSDDGLPLETFLGGMETSGQTRTRTCTQTLETFLGGMETSSRGTTPTVAKDLETFLGGMETRYMGDRMAGVATALKPSLVEWKQSSEASAMPTFCP